MPGAHPALRRAPSVCSFQHMCRARSCAALDASAVGTGRVTLQCEGWLMGTDPWL